MHMRIGLKGGGTVVSDPLTDEYFSEDTPERRAELNKGYDRWANQERDALTSEDDSVTVRVMGDHETYHVNEIEWIRLVGD